MANEIKNELEGRGYLVRTASISQGRRCGAALLIMDRIVFGEDSPKTQR